MALFLRHRSGRLIPIPIPVDEAPYISAIHHHDVEAVVRLEAAFETGGALSFGSFGDNELETELRQLPEHSNAYKSPCGDASRHVENTSSSGFVADQRAGQPGCVSNFTAPYSPFIPSCSDILAASTSWRSRDAAPSAAAIDGLTTQFLLASAQATQATAFGLLSRTAAGRTASAASQASANAPPNAVSSCPTSSAAHQSATPVNVSAASLSEDANQSTSSVASPSSNALKSPTSVTTAAAANRNSDTLATLPTHLPAINSPHAAVSSSVLSSTSAASIHSSAAGSSSSSRTPPSSSRPIFEVHSGVLPLEVARKLRGADKAAVAAAAAADAASDALSGTSSVPSHSADPSDPAGEQHLQRELAVVEEELVTVAPHRLSQQLQLCLRYAYGAAASAAAVVAEAPPPYLPMRRVLGMSRSECVEWLDRVERAWAAKLRALPQYNRKVAGVQPRGQPPAGSQGPAATLSSSVAAPCLSPTPSPSRLSAGVGVDEKSTSVGSTPVTAASNGSGSAAVAGLHAVQQPGSSGSSSRSGTGGSSCEGDLATPCRDYSSCGSCSDIPGSPELCLEQVAPPAPFDFQEIPTDTAAGMSASQAVVTTCAVVADSVADVGSATGPQGPASKRGPDADGSTSCGKDDGDDGEPAAGDSPSPSGNHSDAAEPTPDVAVSEANSATAERSASSGAGVSSSAALDDDRSTEPERRDAADGGLDSAASTSAVADGVEVPVAIVLAKPRQTAPRAAAPPPPPPPPRPRHFGTPRGGMQYGMQSIAYGYMPYQSGPYGNAMAPAGSVVFPGWLPGPPAAVVAGPFVVQAVPHGYGMVPQSYVMGYGGLWY